MKEKIIVKTKGIRNFFILLGIKIGSFYKQHKITASALTLFIVTAIVLSVIVNADASVVNNASLASSNLSVASSSLTDGKALNFTTVHYNLKYKLSPNGTTSCEGVDGDAYQSDKVIIKATLPNDAPAIWNYTDETTGSTLSDNRKELTITKDNVNLCSDQDQVIPMTILNAVDLSVVKPTVSITPASQSIASSIPENNIPVLTTHSTGTLNLVPRVQSGLTKKDGEQRLGKFGLLLGFETDEDMDSLKGKYINENNAKLYLSASVNNNNLAIKTGTNENATDALENDDFGAYRSIKKLFASSEVPELSNTSGYIKSLSKNDKKDTNSSVNTKKTTIIGAVKLTYEHIENNNDDIYVDPVVVKIGADQDAEVIICGNTSSDKCSINKNNITQGSAVGSYKITYTVTSNEGYKIIFNRDIEIKDDITGDTSSIHELIGPKTVRMTKEGVGKEILNKKATNLSSVDYNTVISKKSGETYEPIPSLTPDESGIYSNGTYKISYSNNGGETNWNVERNLYVINYLTITTNLINIPEISNIPTNVTISRGTTYNACDGITSCESQDLDISSVGDKEVDLVISSGDSKILIKQNVKVVESLYEMIIKNLNYSFDLTKIAGTNFYAIGSYFITTTSFTSGGDVCLTAASTENNDNVSSKCVSSEVNTVGTNTGENTFYVVEDNSYVKVDTYNKNGKLNGEYYSAAMGEEVELETLLNYGYDAESSLNNLKVTIPVDKNYLKPIAIFDTINETSNGQFVDCSLEDASEESSISNATYKVNYFNGNSTAINPLTDNYDQVDKIEIEISNINITPGTSIKVRTKYQVRAITNSNADISGLKFNNSGVTFSTNNNGDVTLLTTPSTTDVSVTPYKIRSNIKYGKMEKEGDEVNFKENVDLTFDASKNDTYTGVVYTDLISPLMAIQSNILGYDEVQKINVEVVLPVGVNYVYNKNYNKMEPELSRNEGVTTLKYTYYGVNPNAWIEPIYFDFNIDVTAPTDNLHILVKTGDFTDTSIKNDVSSNNKYKQKDQKLIIQNTYDISYGQYIYDFTGVNYISNIDKNESFKHALKLHNNTNSIKENVYAYSIIPNSSSSLKTNFQGTFEIELPTSGIDEIMCTKVDPSNLTVDSYISSNRNTIWESCDQYKTQNGTYKGITGYRIKYDSLVPNENKVATAQYKIIDNNPDDTYEFDSYLGNDRYSEYTEFHKISLDVVSKKITGIVFEDFVINGILDDDEDMIEGITLKLYRSIDDELVQTTTSDKKGVYTFSGLEEGKYYVTAEYNTEKYGLTTLPSQDFYDKSRMSVFKEGTTVTESTVTDSLEIDGETYDYEIAVSESAPIRTDDIEITEDTRVYRYVNLGLTLKRVFKANINKYVSKAIVTDALGVQTVKDYGNAKIAKLDVRNMDKVNIKVVYTLEIENVKYYPGYVNLVTEIVPDGMSFNKEYEENKGWVMTESGILENNSLKDVLLRENDKQYLTIAFDISSKEAGSFINVASIDDVQILGGGISD